jgi:hypothetical protein
MNTNVGVLTDQPIAWAWCNSANTTVVVFDIRLKAVKSLPPVVATSAERDAKFMSPTQGLQVWRDDLGAVETYYGLYNSSTNPGGRDTAGWYTTDRAGGLVPIRPTSAVIATGSGSANALGTVTFSGATAINLNGVFSSAYTSYRLIFTGIDASDVTSYFTFRLRASGTDSTSTYSRMGTKSTANAGNDAWNAESQTQVLLANAAYASKLGGHLELHNPNVASATTYTWHFQGNQNGGAGTGVVASGQHSTNTAYDGITIYPTGGTISGKVTVYGYVGAI